MRVLSLIWMGFAGLTCALAGDAPERVAPVRVCEILENAAAWRGKAVAVIGRFSYRSGGRFVSEESCGGKLTTGSFVWPSVLQIRIDGGGGPHLPDKFDIDSAAADRQLKLLRKSTTLGKFRFGSLDYDRWAIVYGRVEPSPEFETPPANLKPGKSPLEPAPMRLVIRGDGLVFFVTVE